MIRMPERRRDPHPSLSPDGRGGRRGSGEPLAEAEGVEAVVVDAEVVGELVAHGLGDLVGDIARVEVAFEGALVDDDAVGEREGVAAAFGLRDADVEAEEVAAILDVAQAAFVGAGFACDDDGDVVEGVVYLGRERVEGALHETAEAGPIHSACPSDPSSPTKRYCDGTGRIRATGFRAAADDWRKGFPMPRAVCAGRACVAKGVEA